MKRAFLRKVKPVSCPPPETAGQPEQSPTGVHRRARTSAAMFGLALSMGASSLVLPHHDDGATAAEPKGTEATAPSVSQVATLPNSEAEMATFAPAITVVEHVVREGQTLSQIARSYRVNVQDIIAVNHLAVDVIIKPGQTLKIPVNRQFDATAKVAAPELLASADLNQVPLTEPASAEASSATDRNSALSRLHEQRDKLKDSLAGLRSEESSGATGQKTSAALGEASKVESAGGTAAAQPSAAQPQAVAYQVQPGDTLTAIARSQGVSQPSGSQPGVSQPDSLAAPSTLPAQVAESVPSPSILPSSTVQQSVQQSVQQPAQQQVAFAPPLQEYRVSPGDTVAEIARAHSIPQSMLINANRLSDPNVIFVGQLLQVPSTQPTAPTMVSASQPVSQAEAQPVAVLPQVANPTQAAASIPDSRTKTNNIEPNSTETPSTELPTAVQSSSPRYVDNLLAEVRALRAKHQVEAARPASTEQPTMVAARSEVPTATQLGVVSARPQYSTNRANPVPASSSPASAGQATVVAVAPIGSENYAPLRQPITGRTVSPDLPPLAGAEAYLPEGTRSNGYIWPARGMLTSGYGWRWGRMHQGIDIAADVGTPVYAAASGVIEYSDWNSGGYGNMVDIRHPDGSITRYAHLNRSLVHQGQRVRQGEQIAEMGSTGYSTGPHLHFEVHPAGEGAVNPIAYLPGR
ncbi:MAG TPA: peptidoglycan DD-metalloendopeptidase family protein [Coleofasciculaceae cyanobacterium]